MIQKIRNELFQQLYCYSIKTDAWSEITDYDDTTGFRNPHIAIIHLLKNEEI